jgi:hypothetical protein
MGRYGSLDYPRLAKGGLLFGLLLFAVGLLGQLALGGSPTTPAWELTLLLDLEAIGLLVAFFSPFVFGVFLPLTE